MPPEKPGFRKHAANAWGAISAAGAHAGRRVWSPVQDHWRVEIALIAGSALVILVGGYEDPPPTFLPPAIAAVVGPLSVLVAAMLVSFVVLLLAAPFRDHRKLVRERDALTGELSGAQEQLALIERRRALREKVDQMARSASNPIRYMASGTATPEEAADSMRASFASVAQIIREEGAEHGVAELADQIRFDVPDSPTADQVGTACNEADKQVRVVSGRLTI